MLGQGPTIGEIAVTTYFLFVQGWTLDDTWSLCLSDEGDVSLPLAQRPLDLLEIPLGSRVYVILSTSLVGLYEIEMPLLSASKARLAIPFAVEEHVPQKIADLHFAFDRAFYFDGKYLTAVIDKSLFEALIQQLKQAKIRANIITMDWCALELNEMVLVDNRLIVRHKLFNGAIEGNLIERYLNTIEGTPRLLAFDKELDLLPPNIDAVKMNESYHTWVANRLKNKPMLNLCQGEFETKNVKFWYNRWFIITGILLFLSLMAGLAIDMFNIMRFKQAIAEQDVEISKIYKTFFPKATQIISPRFRIESLIKSKQGQGTQVFWHGLIQLTQAFIPEGLNIERIQYRNNTFYVSLTGRDMGTIEKLTDQLKQNHMIVKERNAVLSEKEVKVTLELSS